MNETSKNKKFNLKLLVENRIFLASVSVIMAVFLWYYSYNSFGIKDERIIENVPITIDARGINETFGLEVIEIVAPDELKNRTVDVKITSSMPILKRLTSDDFNISVDTSTITQAGTYRLALNYNFNSPDANVDISQNNPKSITVRFDRIKSQTYEINDVNVTGNVTVKEGYIMETPDCNVKEVTLTGPESVIKKIHSVGVAASVNGVKFSTEVVDGRFVYYDADGNEISDNFISNNYTGGIKVTVPIKRTKTLNLTVDFLNVPKGLENNIGYSITPDKITVKGDADIIETNFVNGNYSIGKIDFKDITSADQSFTFTVSLDDGIETTEELTEITVKMRLGRLKSKTFNLTSSESLFKVINNEPAKRVQIISTKISSVTVYGPAEQINSIKESDIIVGANLSGKQSLSGNCLVPVNFEFKNYDKCWVSTTHEIEVKINE